MQKFLVAESLVFSGLSKDHAKVHIYVIRHGIQLILGEIILVQNFIKIEK